VKKIEQYLLHAAECREMARTAPSAHRQQLEQMAQTWDWLAETRRQQLAHRDGLTVDFEYPSEKNKKSS
jgi:hypothetical protein